MPLLFGESKIMGYSDDMKDLKFENEEFVKLFWINESRKEFSSILPYAKAIQMKHILEVKVLKSWIEKC
jgi:hypothetical protein